MKLSPTVKKETMTQDEVVIIRITDAKLDTYWYADLIGEEYEAKKHLYRDEYRLVGGEAERSLLVRAEDCQEVEA